MNISAISFKGNRIDDGFEIPEWVNRNHPQNRRPADRTSRSYPNGKNSVYSQKGSSYIKRSQQTDSFSRQNKTSDCDSKKNRIVPLPLKTFLAGVLAALAVSQGAQVINQPADKINIPFDDTISLTEMAQSYDIAAEAISEYNKYISGEDWEQQDSITIPTKFDYIQEEIDKLLVQLYDNDLSDEERNIIEDKICQYKEKQELQQNTAISYTDGKYVYYTIIEMPDGRRSINVERFKDIFDIKDGALKTYNDLDYVWARDEDAPPEDNGYRDYTVETLTVGQTVKVRVKDVKLGIGDAQ